MMNEIITKKMTRAQFERYWDTLISEERNLIIGKLPFPLKQERKPNEKMDKMFDVPVIDGKIIETDEKIEITLATSEEIAELRDRIKNEGIDAVRVLAQNVLDLKTVFSTLTSFRDEIEILKSREAITKIMIQELISKVLKTEMDERLPKISKKFLDAVNKTLSEMQDDYDNRLESVKTNVEELTEKVGDVESKQIIIEEELEEKEEEKEKIETTKADLERLVNNKISDGFEDIKEQLKPLLKIAPKIPEKEEVKPELEIKPNAKCQTCGYEWFYKGKSKKKRINCPHCNATAPNPNVEVVEVASEEPETEETEEEPEVESVEEILDE